MSILWFTHAQHIHKYPLYSTELWIWSIAHDAACEPYLGMFVADKLSRLHVQFTAEC